MIWNVQGWLVMGLVLSVIALNGHAQAEAPAKLSEAQRAELEARLDEARTRLELSPEQEEAIRPILAESAFDRGEVLNRYGITADNIGARDERLSFREMRQLRSDMDVVRANTRSELGTVLSPEQMQTWDELAEEARAEMRERIKSRR